MQEMSGDGAPRFQGPEAMAQVQVVELWRCLWLDRTPRMVKKLMWLRAHRISAASQAVRDPRWGLRGLELG